MKNSSNHCVSEQDLAQFVLGDLERERLQAIACHVDDCESCQDTIVALAEQQDTFIDKIRATGEASSYVAEGALSVGLRRMLASLKRMTETKASSTPPMHADLGDLDQIGPYIIQCQLASGGMGNVFRAVHSKLKRTVALKVLPVNRWSNQMAVSRFQREMEAIGQLDHPHIVRASDAGEEDELHYLVMEYVDGLDLSRLVNRLGPLPIAEACELARQTAIGLEYAHENGLVHRDVKPSNLMLAWEKSLGTSSAPTPTVKILDLGLALLGDEHLAEGHELTTVGTLMGTLDYMSPEQGVDSHAVDHRTDIYSLGATLFKLLTGRAPYADSQYGTLMKKMTALATKPAPSVGAMRTDLPSAVVDVVDRMLARDPDERFRSAREVVDELAPLAEDADLAALLDRGLAAEDQPQPSVAPRASALARTHTRTAIVAPETARPTQSWTWIGLIAAAVLAVCAGLVFRIATNLGEIVIRSSDPSATVVLTKGDSQQQFEIKNGERTVRVRVGEYDLSVVGDVDLSIEPKSVRVGRNTTSAVVVAEKTKPGDTVANQTIPLVAPKDLNEHQDIVKPRSRVYIGVEGTLPDRKIEGFYQVEGSGNVHLGPPYGRVDIGGLSLIAAEKAIDKALREFIKEPQVMVTWSRPSDSEVTALSIPPTDAGPMYQGKSYNAWLQQLRTTRDSARILEYMRGVTQLGDDRPEEAATAILQAMRHQGRSVAHEVVRLISTLETEAVVSAMIRELEQGNARSRDFVSLVVRTVTERRDDNNGDFQRLRIVLRRRAKEIAVARIQNPSVLGFERISAEALISWLILYCGLSVDDADQIKLLRQAIDRDIDQHNLHHLGLVVHALAIVSPSTPGLAEKLVEVKRNVDSDQTMFGSYHDRYAHVVGLLGKHAEPIVEALIDELQASLEGLQGGMISLPQPKRVNPLVVTLGAIGPPARSASKTLEKFVQIGPHHASMRRTARLAAEALRKIKAEPRDQGR